MIEFFQNLFGNSGAFVVDTVNAITDFSQNVPSWLFYIFAGIIAIITVRIVINVF